MSNISVILWSEFYILNSSSTKTLRNKTYFDMEWLLFNTPFGIVLLYIYLMIVESKIR
jgi:hypothetical protein